MAAGGTVATRRGGRPESVLLVVLAVVVTLLFAAGPVPTLRYRIEQHGWFTDLDGSATARVPAGSLERIGVRLEHGNIRVTDATRENVVRKGRLKLDLRTSMGRVQRPT